MSKAKKIATHFLLLVLLTASCSRSDEIVFGPGMGGVRIDLSAQVPVTRADVSDLSADDFKVEIINAGGVIFKRWNTYAEYKAQNTAVQMNAGGPYTLRATFGDSTASGWDAWFFKGEQQFTVIPQETVDVSVVCKMANIKVAVEYGANIVANYISYKTTVTNSRGSLVFDMAHKDEAGYMPVGSLAVDVELTDGNGKTWYFRNGSEISAAPGDFITIKLDTEDVPDQEIGLLISIDRTTNDSTVVVDLPSFMLPKAAPVLIPEAGGFGSDGVLTYVEGTEPNANVSISAAGGLAGCTMTVSSSYLKSLGWPETLDFFNLTTDVKNIITRDGLVYIVDGGATMGSIDLSAVARKFAYVDNAEANTHSFTIRITDELGKTAEATYSIVPVAAEKSIAEIPEGHVWATRIENVVLGTSDGDPSLLYPEVMAEGGNWVKPQFTSSVSGTSNTVTITGLTPGTEYSVRARYNNGASADIREVTTETALQVENAGFEEWSEWEYYVNKSGLFWGDDVYQTNYAPYLQESTRWWDSNNSETTPGDRTNTNATYKSFPMVSYVAGRTGERAAQIMTIAISNSAISGTCPMPRSIVAGQLFTGVYGGAQGREFVSRPSSMAFYYKYTPHESDTFKAYVCVKNGDAVIAEGTATPSAASDWTYIEVDLAYSITDLSAQSIYVEFRSSSASGEPPWSASDRTITYGGTKTASVHGGSILTVDDVELIYE